MFGCDRWRAGQAVLLLSALLGGLAACLFFFYIPAVIRRSVNEVTGSTQSRMLADRSASGVGP